VLFRSDDASGDIETTRIPLATNADFLAHPQLASTGEHFESSDRAISIDEDVVEGEVIAGDAVEVELDLSGPTGSWAAATQKVNAAVVRAPQAPAPIQLHQPPPQQLPPPITQPVVPRPAALPPVAAAPAPMSARAPTAAWSQPELPPLSARPAPVAAARPVSSPVPLNPVVAPFDRSGVPLSSESGISQPVNIIGDHRVILHTMEGGVKRGSIRDVDLASAAVELSTSPSSSETVPRERVKAIFFMLAPGSRAPMPEGTKVRVTFRDGRQVAGFSRDHKSLAIGFFVVPADNRTNTERIFIYRHAVSAVQADRKSVV
jgi:hypothetical protein